LVKRNYAFEKRQKDLAKKKKKDEKMERKRARKEAATQEDDAVDVSQGGEAGAGSDD
jgi:hypothetical protein